MRIENEQWTSFVKKYQRRVFSVALSVLRNVEDAEEVVQEVFVKLYTHIDGIRDNNAVPKWLFRTSYNTALNKVRIKGIKKWLLGQEEIDCISSDNDSQEKTAEITDELKKIEAWKKARLSKKENVIIQMKLGEEMTFEEIAEALGINNSSAKTHYYRAVEKMKLLRSEK